MAKADGRNTRFELSEYRGVWLFAMFDLPVTTPVARRRYTQFRTLLLKLGFEMMQFSVYARYFPSEAATKSYRKRIRGGLPANGHVRLLMITDKQFGKMQVFHGKTEESPEQPPDQMLLF